MATAHQHQWFFISEEWEDIEGSTPGMFGLKDRQSFLRFGCRCGQIERVKSTATASYQLTELEK